MISANSQTELEEAVGSISALSITVDTVVPARRTYLRDSFLDRKIGL